ncbi:MAG: hypothetical protein KDA84_14040, partial [Planctomycetaceae bacterium]|nr:hypothetical protein [Planctomycetaceae bacterium]
QQKMMNFMMIFMGFLFYHMPAGLCVYFIASSLWGMGERKLLDLGKKKDADGSSPSEMSLVTESPNNREKRTNTASKKRGKKSSKSRR